MSRSRRHTPILQNCSAFSEKKDKRIAHGKLRARERECMVVGQEFPKRLDEVSDICDFAKDGKHRFNPTDPRWAKYMRK